MSCMFVPLVGVFGYMRVFLTQRQIYENRWWKSVGGWGRETIVTWLSQFSGKACYLTQTHTPRHNVIVWFGENIVQVDRGFYQFLGNKKKVCVGVSLSISSFSLLLSMYLSLTKSFLPHVSTNCSMPWRYQVWIMVIFHLEGTELWSSVLPLCHLFSSIIPTFLWLRYTVFCFLEKETIQFFFFSDNQLIVIIHKYELRWNQDQPADSGAWHERLSHFFFTHSGVKVVSNNSYKQTK